MSLPLPNLKHLHHIVAVANLGSITAAAAACNVSQPALSVTIKEYEALLGFQIFFRNRSKGVALTPNGRRFIQLAQALLEEARQFQSNATGLTETLSGALDLTCYTPLTPHVFPLIYRELRSQHPNISLNLIEGDILEMYGHLRAGSADVAITYDMYVDEGMRFEPFATIVPQVALRRDDPLAAKPAIRISDLAARRMVVLDLPTVETFIRGFLRGGGADPEISFRVKSPQMMWSLVGAGLGFAIFFIAPQEATRGEQDEVVFVPLERGSVTLNIGAAMPDEVPHTGLINAFLGACQDVIRNRRMLEPFIHQI